MAIDSKKVQAVFLEAVARPIDERAAYLDEACREDPQLRGWVEALLRAHDAPESGLEAGEW